MKRILIIFCFAYFAANVTIAQQVAQIGNIKISVNTPSEYENSNKPEFNPTRSKTFFSSIGFIVPNNNSDYFTTLGGSSINFDFGRMHRYQITPRFELGRTLQYSYYNYRSWNAASQPEFVDEVIGKYYDKSGIRKQVYHSHNIAVGGFARFYLVPDKNSLFIDLGAQGDFAFSKYFKIKTQSEGKNKYRNDYAFNPFSASATARVGWKTKSWNIKGSGWNVKGGNNYRAVFVRYRFTDSFNYRALPIDLPPVTIGIQFF